MRRGWVLAAMIAFTAGAVGWMRIPENAVPARIVTVTRGTVESVLPLSGRLGWLDTQVLYSPATGTVAQVLHEAGDRVAAGEALIRLNGAAADAAAAWVRQNDDAVGTSAAMLEELVLRAENNMMIREILVSEGAPVSAGMPVMMLSSADQTIRCIVGREQAEGIVAGMWARLYDEAGEALGIGTVTEVGELLADEETGRLRRMVTVAPEYRLQLPGGAVVHADLFVQGRQDVPVLPVDVITERDTVWWVTDEGTCTEIPAEIVMTDEMNAWVNLPEGLRIAAGEFEEGRKITEERQ